MPEVLSNAQLRANKRCCRMTCQNCCHSQILNMPYKGTCQHADCPCKQHDGTSQLNSDLEDAVNQTFNEIYMLLEKERLYMLQLSDRSYSASLRSIETQLFVKKSALLARIKPITNDLK